MRLGGEIALTRIEESDGQIVAVVVAVVVGSARGDGEVVVGESGALGGVVDVGIEGNARERRLVRFRFGALRRLGRALLLPPRELRRFDLRCRRVRHRVAHKETVSICFHVFASQLGPHAPPRADSTSPGFVASSGTVRQPRYRIPS